MLSRGLPPRHGFGFDRSGRGRCEAHGFGPSRSPWASGAAIKLHVGLDQPGHLPSYFSVTEGKTGDVKRCTLVQPAAWSWRTGGSFGLHTAAGSRRRDLRDDA